MSESDILVAGGGPVGLAAAAALGEAGFTVRLFERAAAPAPFRPDAVDARVFALSPASLALLDRLGAGAALRAARVSPYRRMAVWDDEPQRGLLFSASELGGESLGAIVEHSVLAMALAQALPAGVAHFGQEIAGVETGEDAVSLRFADGATARARLLVAADGPDSPLRAQLGLPTVGWGYGQQALVCHLQPERGHGGTAWQRFLSTGPLALLPLADGRVSLVWSCEAALAEELLALSDAEFALRVSTASQHRLGALTAPTPRRALPLRLLHAQDYFAGRAVLVGDAAHVVHPLAGQGMNLGFGDVAALAAVLGAARAAGRGWWRERTLAAYARQRKAENLEMLALTDGLKRLYGVAPLRRLLGLGLSAVDRAPLLKPALLARALGPAGN